MLKRAKVEFIWDDGTLWQTRRQFLTDTFTEVAKNANAVPRLIDSDFVNEEEDSLAAVTIYFERASDFPTKVEAPKEKTVKRQFADIKASKNSQGLFVKKL